MNENLSIHLERVNNILSDMSNNAPVPDEFNKLHLRHASTKVTYENRDTTICDHNV